MILEDEIRAFLTSEVESYSLSMCPVGDIDNELTKTFGYEREDLDGDSNGWQVDFWYYYYKYNKRICLSGSLWYGNFKLTKEG